MVNVHSTNWHSTGKEETAQTAEDLKMIKIAPELLLDLFLPSQMNHQCGWTNSHSTAGKSDSQNGEVDQPTKPSVSKCIFTSDRMNHQCGCKTEVICHETELATICLNPIGCKFFMLEYIKTYEKFWSAFEEYI